MYTFESRVRYSEADVTRRLSVEGVINYFQDCSTFQSEDLGLGLDYLREQHLAWFVNFWQIDFARYPKTGESIRIGTAPYAFKTFMGWRNFWLETTEKERLAVASSVWTLMDVEAMRPVRIPEIMTERYVRSEPMEMEYLSRKIALPAEEELTSKEPITIAGHHLDSNHHVNNGQYVRLALDAMGAEEAEDTEIERLLVEYKKQAHLGDVILPRCAGDAREKTLLLCDAGGAPGSAYAVCRAVFRPRSEGGN